MLVEDFIGLDIQPQEEVGYGFLIETVLAHLKSNLNSNEFTKIQNLIDIPENCVIAFSVGDDLSL